MANYRIYEDSECITLTCFRNKRDEISISIEDNHTAIISLTRDDVEQLICDLQSLLIENIE